MKRKDTIFDFDRRAVKALAKCMRRDDYFYELYHVMSELAMKNDGTIDDIADGTFDFKEGYIDFHEEEETNKFNRGILSCTTEETIPVQSLKGLTSITIHGIKYRILKDSYIRCGIFASTQYGYFFMVDIESGRRQELPTKVDYRDMDRHKNLCKLDQFIPHVVLDFTKGEEGDDMKLPDDPAWGNRVVIIGPGMRPLAGIKAVCVRYLQFEDRTNGLSLDIDGRVYLIHTPGVFPTFLEVNRNMACWYEEHIDGYSRKKRTCDLLELDKKRVELLKEHLPSEDLRTHLLPYLAPSILF